MDPAALVPTPDTLPVAWGWFQLLLLLTFYFHILLMNVMFGSAFIALVGHFRRDGGVTSCTAAISQNLPYTIAFAVNFGVAPLLFVQVLYGHLFYTSSILMAFFWLSIIALLLLAYSLAYIYKYQYARIGSGRVLVTGLITSSLLLIAFFFTNNLTLLQSPATWSRYFEHPGGLLLNLADPTLFPRFLHFMVSAVAVGGLAIAVFFSWKQRKGDPSARPWIEYGCRWFGSATLLNVIIGLWFLVSLPQGIVTTATFDGILLLLTLASGLLLAVLALIFSFSARVVPALSCILGTLALMICARSLLRTAVLVPWFSVSQLSVKPSFSPFFIFLFFLAASLLLIGWMLKCAFSGKDGEVHS